MNQQEQEALFRLCQEAYRNAETYDEYIKAVISESGGEADLEEAEQIYDELQSKYEEAL